MRSHDDLTPDPQDRAEIADSAKFSFVIPIYGIKVYVFVAPDTIVAGEVLQSITGEKIKDRDVAITAFQKGYAYLIFIAGNISHPVLNHEIAHVVQDIWEYIGVEMSYEAHECETYLAQFIHEKLAKGLLDRKIEIRHR